MASFYDMTIGQQVEFQRVLARAGFTVTDIARINRKPNLATLMYEAIQPTTVTSAVPSWYVTPELQLAGARRLWPDTWLPEPPKVFTPATASEVLLLHVPDTFDRLWGMVVAPAGYVKYREDATRHLRLSPNKREYTQPVWLAFDPEHDKGVSPESLWGMPNLAASEVLSALIQFPDWPLSWLNGSSPPNLSGYQLKRGREWSYIPYLHRWKGSHQIRMSYVGAGDWDHIWASPTVREC